MPNNLHLITNNFLAVKLCFYDFLAYKQNLQKKNCYKSAGKSIAHFASKPYIVVVVPNFYFNNSLSSENQIFSLMWFMVCPI